MSGQNPDPTASPPGTVTSQDTLSERKHTANLIGQCLQLPPGLPRPQGYVSGLILRRPGERMYGMLTLTVCLPDKLASIDFYGADISEEGRRVILDSLDRIAAQLFLESGTIGLEIPLSAPESRTVPSEKERLEKITSDVSQGQQKLLWDESGE